jgi:hypothetical protein
VNPHNELRVRYVVGDPKDWAAASISRRTIVLTQEQFKAAVARFGAFYPLELSITTNLAGDRAFILWDEQWVGGTLKAKRTKDGWEFEAISQWIT